MASTALITPAVLALGYHLQGFSPVEVGGSGCATTAALARHGAGPPPP
ncbi:hypothetical protein [Ferrimicrobium sp.]|nr:hypothetical protein [Ferrimicrobium sp.]